VLSWHLYRLNSGIDLYEVILSLFYFLGCCWVWFMVWVLLCSF